MKKFNLKRTFAGVMVAVVLFSGVSMMADSTPTSTTPVGTVAQIDVGTPSGGVIAKEAALGSRVVKGQTVLVLNKNQYVAQEKIDKATLANDTQINNRNEAINKKAPGVVTQQDLTSSKDLVAADKATVTLDKSYVKECTVKAPFDGKVSKVINYPGSGVGSGNEVLDVTSK